MKVRAFKILSIPGKKMPFSEPSKLYLTKEIISKINGVVFELIVTFFAPYRIPFQLLFSKTKF